MWAIRSRCRARFGFPGIRQRCGAFETGALGRGQCVLVELHDGDHAFPERRPAERPARAYLATTQAGDMIEAGANERAVMLTVLSTNAPAHLTPSEARLLAHALNVYADEVDTATANRRRNC
jgi:hypothetical protein